MNRNEEYKQLLEDIEAPAPAVEHTLKRAKARYKRRKWVIRPAAGFATFAACFVLLVNFCAPVAYACSLVPGLRELAKAVTFSNSLTDAVKNAYVQPLDLKQTKNDITAKIEYLIVDRKQVNVFYRLESKTHTQLDTLPEVRHPDGSPSSCSYGPNDFNVPNGQLQSITIDYFKADVPSSMCLTLNIMELGNQQVSGPAPTAPFYRGDAMLDTPDYSAPNYVASFNFLLEFDPQFTATGKVIEINKVIDLDGQKLTLTDMEIYPTNLRLNVEGSPENTAWLKRLDFYIETDWGMKFNTVKNGITATGSTDSPMMVSYRADSTYFYNANHLKVVITGAEWLDKDMEKIRLDLKSGISERMPDGIKISEVSRKAKGWIIKAKAATKKGSSFHQIFGAMPYYDAYGKEYNVSSWSYEDCEETPDYFYELFALKDYPYDEVWLSPAYSREWVPDSPVTVNVK